MHSYRSTPEVALSSGDYEAYPAPTLPPARVPVFARQAPHQEIPPPVWGWDPRNDPRALAAPVAPGSLAPVAMGRYNTPTGSVRAVVSPPEEKSSTKWGVIIAVTGAILGGVLGIMMNNGSLAQNGPNPAVAAQNAMEAAQLPAAPQPVAQPPVHQPAQPAVQAPAAAVQGNTAPAAPAAPAQHATKDDPKDKHDKKGHHGHHVTAVSHHHAPAPAAPIARTHTKPIVAASVPDSPREKPVTRKEKEDKTEKKAEKTAETTAAENALKQASKETSLSLGGSK